MIFLFALPNNQARAAGNTTGYAWGENAGWLNFNPAGGGVTVPYGTGVIAGYAWGENIGWLKLDPTGAGVSKDASGNLTGFAWAENGGWVRFNPTGGGVTINISGNWLGYAWGENIGWLKMNPPGGGVNSTLIPPCASHNLSGYAWSETIGWISFACPTLGTGTDYGVDLEQTTGKFSGYAWSENIGWISFNKDEFGNCPASPCQPKLDNPTSKVSGWARACAVFQAGCSGALKPDSERGGWDGWLSLAGTTPDYEVSLNTGTREFEGWAWADTNVGWVSFNCKNENICPTSNYKVTTSLSFITNPPTNLQAKAVQVKSPPGAYYFDPYNVQDLTLDFSWTPDSTQTKYQIQVASDPGFGTILWDTHKVTSSASTDITYAGSPLDWGTGAGNIYYWQVKTEANGKWSEWSAPARFMTNRYPLADFSYTRSIVGPDVIYTLISTSIDPDSENPTGFASVPAQNGSVAGLAWDLDGDQLFNDGADPVVEKTYDPSVDSVTVRLRATDDGGLQNTKAENILLKYLPQLKAEKGDIYSKSDIQGKNINFDAAFLIHSGGQITNVPKETFSNYGTIDFPGGANQYVNILGKIDWEGLKSQDSRNRNKYGYEVEVITNPNQIDNPLAGKIYYYNGNLQIQAGDLTFSNASGRARGNGLILVNGDLTVSRNITYQEPPVVNNLKNLASVGWLIKGDLIIDPGVQNLVGAFVVLGDGNNDCDLIEVIPNQQYRIEPHCGLVKTGSSLPGTADIALEIRGLVFARRLFFQRAVKSLAPDDYAEKIIYDHRLFLNPPPGMEDFIKGLPVWQKVAP